MNCPVCKDPALVMSERQGIEIDYCPSCRGVWLDRGELDKIIERSTQETPAAAVQPPPGVAFEALGTGPPGLREGPPPGQPRKEEPLEGTLRLALPIPPSPDRVHPDPPTDGGGSGSAGPGPSPTRHRS